LAGLAVAALLTAIGIRANVDPSSARPWLFFVSWTVFLFWWVVRSHRPLWKRLGFWLAIVVLLGAHLPTWLLILGKYPQWRPVWFIPFVVGEIVLFGTILDMVFNVKPENTR
jgi:hypothetical protein